MAMISCRECGKEISDQAEKCPYCGCPIVASQQPSGYTVPVAPMLTGENRKKKFPVVPVVIAACVVLTGGIVTGAIFMKKQKNMNAYSAAERLQKGRKYEEAAETFRTLGKYSDAASRAEYCDAMEFLNNGDYENAYEILTGIPDYAETNKVMLQIYYETRLFEGLTIYRQALKNPDSMSLNRFEVYYDSDDDAEHSEDNPYYIAYVTGQNGLGGYAGGYVLLSEDEGKMEVWGTCKSTDADDLDDLSDKLTAILIEAIREEDIDISEALDKDRVETLISNKTFTKVKSISGQEFPGLPEEWKANREDSGEADEII